MYSNLLRISCMQAACGLGSGHVYSACNKEQKGLMYAKQNILPLKLWIFVRVMACNEV
jgi:hypothetical protein